MKITLQAGGDRNCRIGTSAMFLAPLGVIVTIPAWIGAPTAIALAVTLVTVALCITLICAWHWPAEDKTITIGRKKAAKLEIPSKFFMPYCVCPKCGTEALHWMKTAQIDENDEEALLDFYDRAVRGKQQRRMAEMYRPCGLYLPSYHHLFEKPPSRKERLASAREWARTRAEKTDLIRECRDCGNTWGQKVGATELLAS